MISSFQKKHWPPPKKGRLNSTFQHMLNLVEPSTEEEAGELRSRLAAVEDILPVVEVFHSLAGEVARMVLAAEVGILAAGLRSLHIHPEHRIDREKEPRTDPVEVRHNLDHLGVDYFVHPSYHKRNRLIPKGV